MPQSPKGSGAAAVAFVLVIGLGILGQETDLGHQTRVRKESRKGHSVLCSGPKGHALPRNDTSWTPGLRSLFFTCGSHLNALCYVDHGRSLHHAKWLL